MYKTWISDTIFLADLLILMHTEVIHPARKTHIKTCPKLHMQVHEPNLQN
jgi:hypothetical protein